MAKPAKSQWDFGELFPTEAVRKVLTVAELTTQVKRLLEKQVGRVWVTGEVTNLRAQGSGHIYFTLKDAESQLSCVLFRNEARESRELLADGRKIIVQGDLTVYEPRGQYQLRVTAVELQGVGALQAAFEKLKQKLNAEGLFASERKRPLPRYPQRIGVATSMTGAAIRDVIHVVQRRNPSLQMIVASCRVQGDGAAAEIATAIRLLNRHSASNPASALDLILLTRGGGSLEDLWAFNEEAVARAIFESALPVVSAVGHEIDFTISDFVADLRAATPSAAAEILTEGVFSSLVFISHVGDRMKQAMAARMDDRREMVEQLRYRLSLVHPRRRVNELLQRLDDLQTGLRRCVQQGVRDRHVTLRNAGDRLRRLRPAMVLERRRDSLRQLERRFQECARKLLRQRRDELAALASRLRLLGPEQVLSRGYSITTDAATGKVLRSAAETKAGQKIRSRLKSGELRSRVED